MELMEEVIKIQEEVQAILFLLIILLIGRPMINLQKSKIPLLDQQIICLLKLMIIIQTLSGLEHGTIKASFPYLRVSPRAP